MTVFLYTFAVVVGLIVAAIIWLAPGPSERDFAVCRIVGHRWRYGDGSDPRWCARCGKQEW